MKTAAPEWVNSGKPSHPVAYLRIITGLHLKNKSQCCQTPPFSCPVCMWESLYKNLFPVSQTREGKKCVFSLFWKTKGRQWLHACISCCCGSLKASVQTAEGCGQVLGSTLGKVAGSLSGSWGLTLRVLWDRDSTKGDKELEASFYYGTLT